MFQSWEPDVRVEGCDDDDDDDSNPFPFADVLTLGRSGAAG